MAEARRYGRIRRHLPQVLADDGIQWRSLPVAQPELRRQLEALTPARRWLKDQPEGSELDLDACVRAYTDRLSGYTSARQGGYRSCERRERDLCCLVLADLSLIFD